MAEFTQEQIDKMIADKVAESRKGYFSQEDLDKKVMSEVDRRVETGIQKGLETSKTKWESDFSERAKLSADELAKKDFDERMKDVSSRELEIRKRANKLEARDMLSEAQIPKSQYDKVIGMLVSDDEAITKANVQGFIEMFTSTKTELETKIKSEFSNIPKPKVGSGDGTLSKDDFIKMPYAQKLLLKQTNPEVYKTFIK